MARGPKGTAPLPPSWLGDVDLPIDVLPAGTVLHRVHRLYCDPVFFGPGPAVPPVNRFDSAAGAFGVLYAALDLAVASAETLLRNPQRRLVPLSAIQSRAASRLMPTRPLRVVRLHGEGLQRLSTDNRISTGPYEACGQWSDALWSRRDRPDGIAYRSRHDSDGLCLALFERPGVGFDRGPTQPLARLLPAIADVLDRYGKSVDPFLAGGRLTPPGGERPSSGRGGRRGGR